MRDYLERLLGLKFQPAQLQYARDPYNIFDLDFEDRKPLRTAAILAILFHILLFLIVFPSFGDTVLIPTQDVLVLKSLARPAALLGGGERPKAAPPKPEPVIVKPKPILVPIPDPTPLAPEPIRKLEAEKTPQIRKELTTELDLNDIQAPPGPVGTGGRGQGKGVGTGTGPASGAGPATGDGSGVYKYGSGVSNPVPIVQTTPSYTDDAIKAKVQGVVWLQAIIRKDGSVDSFKVLRALGHGLEEQAIQEIASNWRFRPGTLNGNPVDVLATIEVQFNLR